MFFFRFEIDIDVNSTSDLSIQFQFQRKLYHDKNCTNVYDHYDFAFYFNSSSGVIIPSQIPAHDHPEHWTIVFTISKYFQLL